MSAKSERIDIYISKAMPFAQPILNHLRELVHSAHPGIEEGWKWSFPHFLYQDEIVCSMASFKGHCAFGFWKASLLKTGDGIFRESTDGMGSLGKIRSLSDLPSDNLIREAVLEAVTLIDGNQKVPRIPKSSVENFQEIPADFQKLLNENPAAKSTLESFSKSNRREYLEWISDAKTEATRTKRMSTSIEWLNEGKIRNWKYA